MLRWISTFEGLVVAGLCLFLFAPLAAGLVLRVLRRGSLSSKREVSE